MNKEMIGLAMLEVKASGLKLSEDEKQFVIFYAYKMNNMAQVKLLLKEMEHASEPGEMDDIFRRYSKQMNLRGGIEHLAENLLVYIERYRIEQENAIGYLANTLKVNGISISEEEIRQTEMVQMKEKIMKEASR